MVRIKERYLLVNILYPGELGTKAAAAADVPDLVVLNQPTTDALTPPALLRGIRAEITALFGDYGSGMTDGGKLVVKYLAPATSTFILRVSRAHYRLVWAALTFMNRVPVRNGKACTFRVVHVSGTIRKVEEEAVRRARDLCFAVRADAHPAAGKKLEDPLGNLFVATGAGAGAGAGATARRSTRSEVAVRGLPLDQGQGQHSDVEMGETSDD